MDLTDEDVLGICRDARLWRRLMDALREHAMGTDEQLLELARISVRDAMANEQLWRDDRGRAAAYNALEALVEADVGHGITISRTAGTFEGVEIVIEGDTITRDELADALLSMARARGVGGAP